MEVSHLQAAWYAGKIAIDEGGVVHGTRLGTRIGPYEVGRLLGEGAMAAVHEAVRATDGRRVALKLLHPALAANPAARARFLEEARLGTRLRDPHVVEVLDSGEADDQVYLAMELLEGEDLARRIQREGALPVDEAAEILIPVCEAVALAHRRGITHRDLKPSNIFLAVRDGRTEPVVLDFGIAQQRDEAPLAGDGPAQALFGTPLYLAPELVADPQAASPASDQYALGVILYEALTGAPPYAAGDLRELLALIAAGEPRPPRARRAEISLDLDAVVQRAMSREPDERFPSVSDLGRALAPFAPAERLASGRRRALSSPAIEVEAAVPSPFLKTISPDLQPDSAPWFVAPVPPPASARMEDVPAVPAAEAPLVLPPVAARLVAPARPPATVALEDVPLVPATAGRRRVLVLCAVAVGAAALLLLVRGGRPRHPEPPAVATAPAPPATPAPPVQPPAPPPVAAAVVPPPVEAPAPAASEPVAATAPEPAAAPPPARQVVAEPAPPTRQVAAKPAPPTRQVAAEAPPPARQAAAEPASPARQATAEPAPPERPSKPRARPRAASEVRMHNGVPLLD